MAAGAKLIASLLACGIMHRFAKHTGCYSSPVEGSVLTVNKNTGNIFMFSTTPGLYSVMNLRGLIRFILEARLHGPTRQGAF